MQPDNLSGYHNILINSNLRLRFKGKYAVRYTLAFLPDFPFESAYYERKPHVPAEAS